MFKQGYDKLLKEIEITQVLKSLRILKAHAKKDFSRIQWRFLKLRKGMR